LGTPFAIFGTEESLCGLSVILKTEGISFATGESGGGETAVLRNLAAASGSELARPPSLTCLCARELELAKEVVERAFGISCREALAAQKGNLRFRRGPVYQPLVSLLQAFGFSEVSLPIEGLIDCDVGPSAEVLAEIEVEGKIYPAIVSRETSFLVTFDLGQSFLSLLGETYCQAGEERNPLSPIGGLVYRKIPYGLRLAGYRFFLRQAHQAAAKARHFTTKSPVDPAGWVIYQILVKAMEHSLACLPRLWKWPGMCDYAFCFTHDVEPQRYAYYRGLPRLLDILSELNVRSTFSIVAEPPFNLPKNTLRALPAHGHQVISHGLYHDGTFSTVNSNERSQQIAVSRKKLERLLGVPVRGFRAPWLQRTGDLARLLEEQGFDLDSSLVDVDTSLKRAWFGRGTSFNFPFRLLSRGGAMSSHQVLEVPVTGPQDMEPYFAGLNLEECKELFRKKHDWLRSIGGVYVFLAHAGVYGRRDEDLRMTLLRHLHSLLERENVWQATLGQVRDWWLQREDLSISQTDDTSCSQDCLLEIKNEGTRAVSNFSLAISTRLSLKTATVRDQAVDIAHNGIYSFVPISEIGQGEKIVIGLSGENRRVYSRVH
jgi:peptidoglycan/xylan/chitin deacetylase (PgdA/CDA1 family)